MKRFLRMLFVFLLILGVGTALRLPVQAQQHDAREISGAHLVTDQSGFQGVLYLFDGKVQEGYSTKERCHLTLEYADGIGSLYLTFLSPYGEYTITDNDTGERFTAGTDLFVHEFVDLTQCFSAAPKSVTISFENGQVQLHELDVYTEGNVPDSVQRWNHPVDNETDLVLFATHSDDDQLFFAGLLPYYAVERGYQVQVVYLTNHHNTAAYRIHEMLNGLWAVGVKTYPVFGAYQDFGDATSLESAFRKFEKQGHTRESMTGFVVSSWT